MAAGLKIPIPLGISPKDKSHTKKKTKHVTPRKSNQHEHPNTVKKSAALLPAVTSSVPRPGG